MAEQSIGMATGTGAAFGDGNVGSGYASSRMTAMETKTLSDGVLQVGGEFAMTGVGTGTLTISDGAAVVGGYFYENTSSAAIVISTLANATYNVAILVNNTAGSLTVSRSVAGTTVGTYSLRLVVATSAQLSGQTYVQLGTVQVAGAVIAASGIVHNYAMYGTTTQLPYQSYATMSGGSATLTNVTTQYDVVSFSASTVSSDNIFSVNTTTGVITVRRAGFYMIGYSATYASGTTGQRNARVNVNGSLVQSASITPATSSAVLTALWLYTLAANDTVSISTNTITAAGQTASNAFFSISRA